MKLRLPKKFTTALIAAVTAIGLTLPQSYAEIAWSGGLQDSFGYTRVFYMNNNANATLTDTDDSRFMITSNVDGANPTTGEITSVVTKDGALMRISGGNAWGSDRILNPLLIDRVQAGDGSGTVSISTEQWDTSRAASNTTVSILAVSGTVGGVENYGVLTLGADFDSSFNLTGGINNNMGTVTLNGTYMFDTTDVTKYVLRQEGSVIWTDEANKQGFKKISGSTYYVIMGATDGFIGSVTSSSGDNVTRESSGNYYFTSGVEVDFDYTTLYVNNDGGVSYAAAQTIAEQHGADIATVVLNATDTSIIMDAEATVALSMAFDADTATVLATEDISLSSIAGPETGKSLVFSAAGHTITVQGDNAFSGNVVVGNGALIAGSANALGSGAVIVSGGNLDLGGHSISNSVDTSGESSIGNGTLQGDLTLDNASLTIEKDLTLAGNLVVENANRVEVADGATLYLTHTITNENNIELSGRIDISAISGTETGNSSYVGGETKGNGFLQSEYAIMLINCGLSGDLDWSKAEIYHGGNEVVKEGRGGVTYTAADYTSFYVNSGEERFSCAQAVADQEGAIVSTIVLADGTAIDMDVQKSVIINLTLGGDATVNATAAPTTISSISGWENNTLTITGSSAVYLLPSISPLKLEGSTKMDVRGNVTTGKIQLNSDDARLTVGEEGVLTTDRNNLTITRGAVDIYGTANVGYELDLSDGGRCTGKLTLHTGAEVAVAELWMSNTSEGILLEEGATLGITRSHVKFIGMGGGITTTAPNVIFSPRSSYFTINNAIITALADINIGNTLVEGDVVTGAHAVTLSNAASTYGDITVSEGGRLIANADLNISGTLKLAAGSSMQGSVINIGDKVSVRPMDGSGVQIGAGTDISETEMHGVEGKGVLENVSMETSANYTIKDMSISGSLIDVGEGTTLYLVNVGIHSDTHITDEAAWLDMQATQGWLNHDNTQVVKEYTTEQDITLFKSGDTGRSITLAAGTEIVELTSAMFDTVTLAGTDLWLDMTGIAEFTYNKDYFTLDFKNLAHSLENAQVDVDHLHVYATLDGERYTEAYSTANGGLTTTLYFAVPEPATSTLSLLALAAFVARRRRK